MNQYDVNFRFLSVKRNAMNWIFITERLPNKEERKKNVLVYDKEEGVCEASYHGGTFDYPYYGQEIGGNFNNVIAWSEMPKPPKT